MKILITGANGFVGKNLTAFFAERKDDDVVCFTREHSVSNLLVMLDGVDFVFHLAGINRPVDPIEFTVGNINLTQSLCDAIVATGRRIPVLYTSSIQAKLINAYGESKLGAEEVLLAFSEQHGSPVHILRLPNIFGKWSRPNYNSVVATFCYSIIHDLPIRINDPAAFVSLVYIDDVINHFIAVMDGKLSSSSEVAPQYNTSVADLVDMIRSFRSSRTSLITEAVGSGLVRALYSTYVSYLPPESFSYDIPKYGDQRGVFVEMLKTHDSGQFSYFTAHRGVTRGGHYHHSKTEKFLVIKGSACFRFRNIDSGVFYETFTTGEQPTIVETVPGWTHDITNVGDDEMIVMLWANEIFDRENPDTFARPVGTAP